MANDMQKKIIAQVEYYFGDINLPRDKFLQEKIKEDDGWVALEVLLSFKRLAGLTKDEAAIADALLKSDKKLIFVSDDKKKIKRSPDIPLPEWNDERRKELMSRTAYAKGFPLDEVVDNIEEFMAPFGPFESCHLRTYNDKLAKEQKFKGSIFVIFKDVETCKKFVELESVPFKDVELVRKMQETYFEEKKKEIEDRKLRKKGKTNENKEDAEKPIVCIPGTIIYFNGINKEETITREEIKAEIAGVVKSDISFVDYSKGLTEGYIRFQDENAAIDFYEKLTEGKLKVADVELTFRLLEKTEEEEYKKKVATQTKERKFKNKKFGNKFNKKRKGNFGNDGPRSKK